MRIDRNRLEQRLSKKSALTKSGILSPLRRLRMHICTYTSLQTHHHAPVSTGNEDRPGDVVKSTLHSLDGHAQLSKGDDITDTNCRHISKRGRKYAQKHPSGESTSHNSAYISDDKAGRRLAERGTASASRLLRKPGPKLLWETCAVH